MINCNRSCLLLLFSVCEFIGDESIHLVKILFLSACILKPFSINNCNISTLAIVKIVYTNNEAGFTPCSIASFARSKSPILMAARSIPVRSFLSLHASKFGIKRCKYFLSFSMAF